MPAPIIAGDNTVFFFLPYLVYFTYCTLEIFEIPVLSRFNSFDKIFCKESLINFTATSVVSKSRIEW